MECLRWQYNHGAGIVPPSTLLAFVTNVSQKRKSTSPSRSPVEYQQKTISIAEKLDVNKLS